MRKKIIVAPINSESEGEMLYPLVREFPTERMMLLTSPDGIVKAEDFQKELGRLGIPVSIVRVPPSGNPWEDYFTMVSEVLDGQEKDDIVINISSADRISQCALTNAAHVNGMRAVAIINNEVMMLPILKLSYSNMLSPKKVRILKELHKSGCRNSLEELSRSAGMSLQLLSYHINGSKKSKGLSELELVDTKEEKGRTRVCLSTMGRLFMKGFLG